MNDQSSDSMLSIDAVPLPTTDDIPAKEDSRLSVDSELVTSTTDDNSTKEDDCTDEENTFYDAGILYLETDYEEVTDLIGHLENLTLENGEKPKIDLFDIISQESCSFSQIDSLIRQCLCIIIYLTPGFVKDSTLIFKTNEILMNSFDQKKGSKNWPIMFLASQPLELPIGMKSLCITKMYINHNLAFKKLKKMLQTAQRNRKLREKQFKNLRRPEPLLRPRSMSIKSPSPDVNNTPIVYNINVNAANVQIGDNTAMYGVSYALPDPEISERNHTPSPQINLLEPSSLRLQTSSPQHLGSGEGLKYESDISETNLQIPASLTTSSRQEPDSSCDTLK